MHRKRELSELGIARDLGEALAQRLVAGCIRDLQRIQDCLLSGDDSPLRSIWEEICVQQQRELSFFLACLRGNDYRLHRRPHGGIEALRA